MDGLDLGVRSGEIYGFLGPNGAGKTTTLMMLLGISQPTSGEILLFGERYGPARMDLRLRIGMVPEKHLRGVWSRMTAREYLDLFAGLYSIADAGHRISTLLEKTSLAAVANTRIREFSHGMLPKLSIVRALLPSPPSTTNRTTPASPTTTPRPTAGRRNATAAPPCTGAS